LYRQEGVRLVQNTSLVIKYNSS